ncbi:MAG TPA: hypothetical protein VGK73_38110 [Polyangiaceae bacterium]
MLKSTVRLRHRVAGAILGGALASGATVVACSSEAPVDRGVLPPAACTSDVACPTGKYCEGGRCKQDCVAQERPCGAGQECSANGRCVDGAPGSGGNGGTAGRGGGAGTSPIVPVVEAGVDDAMGDADACAETSVELSTEIPNVLLLVDRSGSMSEELAGGLSRWASLRTALIDPTTGLVPTLQATVNLGLALYTGPDRGAVGLESTALEPDPDYTETDVCPYLVQVPVAPSNGAAIQAAYLPQEIRPMSLGQTPTGESLEAALPALTSLDPALYPGRKVIVLATDGEPDLCENGNDEQGGRQRSVAAVEAAFTAGITTFVISVGDQVGQDHLRELANLGQGFPADDLTDRFYRADDAASLAQAFEDIVTGVRSCTFTLDGMVTGDGHEGSVTVDGVAVVQNDPNGWRLNGPSEVELLGTTCELVKMGDHSIDVSFPCGVVIPVPK